MGLLPAGLPRLVYLLKGLVLSYQQDKFGPLRWEDFEEEAAMFGAESGLNGWMVGAGAGRK